MDSLPKKHCHNCGAALLLAIVLGTEMLSSACHKCGHVDEPHIHETNRVGRNPSIQSVVVSGSPDSTFTIKQLSS